MNETQKTGIFWGVAAVVALIAAIVSWPSSNNDDGGDIGSVIGTPLFSEFKDPLTAASLKIVTFNEAQGELKNFEVRKDAESGLWTIPSKGGYPADAIEQMRDSANALVGLDVLDVPTDNPEDHPGMGVVEPKLEDLEPGDEGVGRLVTFKDSSQKVLASLIVGNEVKGQEGQVYVRKPGQDPVYVVKLDDTPLSTEFQEWIEEDLLQLSSIDIDNVELKDYNASLGLQGVSLTKNYDVELAKDNTTWTLTALKEYDKTNPLAEPTLVPVEPGKELNSQKLNDLANALDDLKFVDVNRKPEGISANLKADKDFAADQEAANQLAGRGFIPVPLGPNREIEILSANGELTATTKDGVKYILRFGNISGIADDDKGDEDDASSADGSDGSGGVNRYLMVSTVVDESKFPVPELKPIPQTLEELDALDKPAPPADETLPTELNPAAEPAPATPEMKAAEPQAATEEPATEEPADSKEVVETEVAPKEDAAAESPAEKDGEEASTETEPAEPEATESADSGDDVEPAAGETDASGEGESTTVGEAQEEVDGQASEEGGEEVASDEGDSKPAETTEPAEMPEPAASDAPSAEVEETEEEKLERLAAVQEKITKENERKLEDRKEKLQQARLTSQALNERFADWYYVIPEATYSKLRISREELFDTSGNAAPNRAAMPPGMQNMQIPGFPGN
ncbi:hypothetical protein Enr13x_64760 [Stieleria neptunia]|uniref:DUF4340 domain-containing protein n=1 Tax=Stieleria neptunia TaxID=2527979 RepID=A0A518I0L2_9BACT|nr:DUF4340 domain-containing protein [Stieleria neptunia]QDV46567.1 hypothetical protein Enr13x_64760 [Stieleria neptunia]